MTSIPPVQQPVKSGTATTQNKSPQHQAAQQQAQTAKPSSAPTQNPSQSTQGQSTQGQQAPQGQANSSQQASPQPPQQSTSTATQAVNPQQQAQIPSQTQQHQIQVKTPASIPQAVSKELVSGQSIRVEVQKVPNQATNRLTLQTPSGPLTVTAQSGTQVLPPPNTQANLHVSFHSALAGQAAQGDSPLLLNLSWSGSAVKASATAQGSATNVTLNTLQGTQISATTLSESSISHLLPKTPTGPLSPSPAVHASSIRGGPASAAQSSTPQNIPTMPTPQGPPISPNQSMNVQIASVQLPNQTLPAGLKIPSSGPTGMPAIQATVLASQPGNTIIQTSVGPMSLPTPSPLPPGSLLTLIPLSEPVSVQVPVQTALNTSAAIQERWAMLQHAMSMLQAGNPQVAQQIMQAMPQANTQMATSILFLLSTLRGGALENWVGRSAASRISGPMGDRLVDSIKQNTRQIRDPMGQEWRAYGMPVAQDSSFGELWLYLKDKSDEEKLTSNQDDEAKRFIIETSFQKMGPLQLDGLATQKTVDLMFRSLIPVEEKMRDDIRALFGNTITALGLTGTIRFHVADHFPVSITEESVTLGGEVTI
ncbi:hypothetical protein [Curvivirga sp.]|uniref:hypothetical protein n=1 Tax=Curvivirga sp. TaxID=2856848 RepID=UPI003B5CC252